jgi:glycosyltransferase involved in cell wall biosynthesis
MPERRAYDDSMTPLVSVLTPTHNGAAFLAETVSSVLGQTYANIEHVLVDDASTDETPELLADLARLHGERIRVVGFSERAGPCQRRNDALGVARGELIAWLDHDDLFVPDKLDLQVDALAAAPDASFVFSQYEEFEHSSGRTIFRSALGAGDDLLDRLFVEGCFVASSSVVFRRAALARVRSRLYDAHFSFGDDYYLWLALLLVGRGLLVDDSLVRLRRHVGNESRRLAETNFHVLRLALLRDFLDEFPQARARIGEETVSAGLAHHAVAAASWDLAHGRRLQAARQALRAASYHPSGAARFLGRAARRAALRRGLRRR